MKTSLRRKLKPWILPCPLCRTTGAPVRLHLVSLDEEDGQFSCNVCLGHFGRDDLDASDPDTQRAWLPILTWLEIAPHPEPEANDNDTEQPKESEHEPA